MIGRLFIHNCFLFILTCFPAISAWAQQPVWTATNSLFNPTIRHRLVRLANGQAMSLGGVSCNNGCSSSNAELYDPATQRWSRTRAMLRARTEPAATVLVDGRVLVSGGYSSDGGSDATLASTEMYDVSAATWTEAAPMQTRRLAHDSVLLPGGNVLVYGGFTDPGTGAGQVVPSAEIYSPKENRWTPAGLSSIGRIRPAAVLLNDGRVLVCGGSSNVAQAAPIARCELFDPAKREWSETGVMRDRRLGHGMVLLPNGKVLAVGGSSTDNVTGIRSAEIYDPTTGAWRVTGQMKSGRTYHSATVLPSGMVLAAGGAVDDKTASNTSELFDPDKETWTDAANLSTASTFQQSLMLTSGKVLMAGGISGGNQMIATAQYFGLGKLATGGLGIVSAASFFDNSTISTGAFAAAFGTGLSDKTVVDPTLPLSLNGVSVRVNDAIGSQKLARIYVVSPTQVNFLVPDGLPNGLVTVSITRAGNTSTTVGTGQVMLTGVSPGLFSANATGSGPAAAVVLKYPDGGAASFHLAAQTDANGQTRTVPIQLGGANDQVYLSLFGTGIRGGGGVSAVRVTIGSVPCQVTFMGASAEFDGLDQVNVLIDRSLAGAGEVEVALSVLGRQANPVRVQIQ
jgi:uncharacterized protein (TIGR03437 family)